MGQNSGIKHNLSTENYYFFSPDVALDASKPDLCWVPSSDANTLLEVLLVSGLPLDQSQIAPLPTDDRQTARVNKEIARVAKDMIAEHGNTAIAQADQRHQTWVLIREVIRDMQESDAKKSHA